MGPSQKEKGEEGPLPTETTPLRQASPSRRARRREESGSVEEHSSLFDRLLLLSSNGFVPPPSQDRLAELNTPFAAFVFEHSLPISVLVQGGDLCLSAFVTHFWKGSFFDSFVVMTVSLIAQGMQVAVLYMTLGICVLRLRYSKVWITQLGMAYCSTLLTFTGLYWISLHVFDRTSFVFYPDLGQLASVANVTQTRIWEPLALLESEHTNDLTSYFGTLLYFSIVTMSGTGFGDIVPARWFTKLFVSAQMLTNIGFQITIIAFATHHFTNVWKPLNANIAAVESPDNSSSSSNDNNIGKGGSEGDEKRRKKGGGAEATTTPGGGEAKSKGSPGSRGSRGSGSPASRSRGSQGSIVGLSSPSKDLLPSMADSPATPSTPNPRGSTDSTSSELPPHLVISLIPPAHSPVTLLIGDTRSSSRRLLDAPKSRLKLALTRVLDGMLLYSLIFECMNIGLTVAMCETNEKHPLCETWVPMSQVIQLAHCLWLCWFSGNLVWNTVQPSIWIFKSYTTVSFLFAGLYFTFLSCGGGISGNLQECHSHNWRCWFGSYVDGIYFSATAMSLAGYGDVFPTNSLARLCVSVQILIGVTYFNLIFGLGAARIVPKLPLARVAL